MSSLHHIRTLLGFKAIASLVIAICIPGAFADVPIPNKKLDAAHLTQYDFPRLGAISAKYGAQEFPFLQMSDGSQITTVWPAAICVDSVEGRPCRPECEPAIYSVARISPDGKYLWAKSYLVRSRNKYLTCDSRVYGFEVRTPVYVVIVDDDSFLLPDEKAFVLATGADIFKNGAFAKTPTEYLMFDASTGNALSKVPSNIRVVDAGWVQEVKEKSWTALLQKNADKTLTNNFDFKRVKELFLMTEKTIFSHPNSSSPSN